MDLKEYKNGGGLCGFVFFFITSLWLIANNYKQEENRVTHKMENVKRFTS